MNGEETAPIFAPPPRGPRTTRAEWIRVSVLVATTVVIGILGAASSIHQLHLVPNNFDPICLQDPGYSYGIPEALDKAAIWMVIAIWAAFASACCATWIAGRAWRWAAIVSGVGLVVEGAIFTFLFTLSQLCQG